MCLNLCRERRKNAACLVPETLKGKNVAYPVPETLKGRMSHGRESRIPHSGDALGRKSASQGANGQAYAPSEVSGILFYKPIKTV